MTATVESPLLSEEEINQRVGILHKLRDHLLEQRNRFYKYLDLLEHEEKDILQGNVEKLQFHAAMEKDLANEIVSFQRVINPLNDMYKINSPDENLEIPRLQESLEHIRSEVVERSGRNQELLQTRMAEIKNEIKSVRKSNRPKSIYDDYANRPSMIDITT
jgi:hypothetical protein